MQNVRADHYLGKRVRFSAFVKTEWAQELRIPGHVNTDSGAM